MSFPTYLSERTTPEHEEQHVLRLCPHPAVWTLSFPPDYNDYEALVSEEEKMIRWQI